MYILIKILFLRVNNLYVKKYIFVYGKGVNLQNKVHFVRISSNCFLRDRSTVRSS